MKSICVAFAILIMAVSAQAQFLGLPIADNASAPVMGETRVSGGVIAGNDQLYGARLMFAPLHRLALFGDVGVISPDKGRTSLAYQGGLKFTVPMKEHVPVDVAVRALWGYASYDLSGGGELTRNHFSGGVMVGRDVSLFSPYAYVGLAVDQSETRAGGDRTSDSDVDPALAFGTLLRFTENFSLYAEFAFVENALLGVGARWTF